MTLQQLRYAVEVANRGSMNEAAKKLYVSQPSLSSAIRELEREGKAVRMAWGRIIRLMVCK